MILVLPFTLFSILTPSLSKPTSNSFCLTREKNTIGYLNFTSEPQADHLRKDFFSVLSNFNIEAQPCEFENTEFCYIKITENDKNELQLAYGRTLTKMTQISGPVQRLTEFVSTLLLNPPVKLQIFLASRKPRILGASCTTIGCLLCNDAECGSLYAGFYYGGVTGISRCGFGCKACNSSNDCQKCFQGHFLNGTSCTRCPENCLNCVSASSCDMCQFGYYSYNNVCFACMDGCLICKNSTSCGQCTSGYYLDSAKGCSRCPPGCSSCSNSSCQSPLPGFLLINSQPVTCPSNCMICKSLDQCKICNSGYALDQNNMCLPCPANCGSCSDVSTCTQCNDFYFIAPDNSCELCKSNCNMCSTYAICDVCFSGYYFNQSILECSACTKGCMSCSSTTCLQCSEVGFTSNSSGCQSCDFGVDYCKSGGGIVCSRGFNLINQRCVACPIGCSSCEGGICTGCIEGYYYSNGCYKCPQGCKTCFSSSCSVCKNGYYLSNGLCQHCSDKCFTCLNSLICTVCKYGYHFNPTNCTACPNYPETCSNSAVPLKCNKGQYLNALNCTSCKSNCEVCSSSDCFKCNEGFYLSSSNCNPCITGCSICSNSNKCNLCKGQYYLSSTGICEPCPSNCLVCNSQKPCITCMNSYTLTSSLTCLPCPTNCEKCDKYKCLKCNPTFFLDQDNICQSCGNNCGCDPGYYNNFGQCSACPFGCSSCISSTVCQNCTSGYYLTQSYTCETCSTPFCQQCDNGECTKCFDRYYLSSGSCFPCSIYCKTCLTYLHCHTCEIGFAETNDGVCLPCPENCGKCVIGSGCTECFPGYSMSDSSCVMSVPNCLIYQNSLCVYCSSGYTELNGKCANCTDIIIQSAKFDEFFQRLIFTFNIYIDYTNTTSCSECKNIINSQSNIGELCTCTVSGSQLIVHFKEWYSATISNIFFIKTEKLFKYVCNPSQLNLQILPTYTALPSAPVASISGTDKKSSTCGGKDLYYSVGEVTNSYGFKLNYTWLAYTTPTSTLIESFVLSNRLSTLQIPSSLYDNKTFYISIVLTVQNVVQLTGTSNFSTNIYNTQLLETQLDTGLNIVVEYSKGYIVTGKLTDMCNDTSANLKWLYRGVEATGFSGGYSNLLYISPYSLKPPSNYRFNFTASSGDLVGWTELNVSVVFSPLVLMLSQSNCSVSTEKNLTIWTNGSYNPNEPYFTIKPALTFTWMYCTGTLDSGCVSNSNVTVFGDRFFVPKSELSGKNGTTWLFTVVMSAFNSSIPNDTKIFYLDFRDGLSSEIHFYTHDFKKEIISYGLILKANFTVLKKADIKPVWVIPSDAKNYVFVGKNLPWLYMYPKTSDNVYRYLFTIQGVEESGASYANVYFTANQGALCSGNGLEVVPNSGVSFDTDFWLSINSCTDIDGDYPLVYRFSVKICKNNCTTNFTKDDPNVYTPYFQLTIKKGFNFIQSKMPDGLLKASVQICDQLGGCNAYKNMFVVSQNTSTDMERIITRYYQDTFNPDQIPFYSIIYILSFKLAQDQYNNIYQNFYTYLRKMKFINFDVVHILLTFINEMFQSSNQFLTTNLVLQYISDANILIARHNDPITDQNVEVTSNILYSIINNIPDIEGNPSLVSIILGFVKNIFRIYAIGRNPGDLIVNITINKDNMTNYQYFKYRDLAENLIKSVPDKLAKIVKSISSFPDINQTIATVDACSISLPNDQGLLMVQLSRSGYYYSQNLTFNITDENSVNIQPLSVYVYINSVILNQICLYFDGAQWQNSQCSIDQDYFDEYYTGMQISTGYLYKIEDENVFNQKEPMSYGPTILAGCIICVFLVVYFFMIYYQKKTAKQQKKKKQALIENYTTCQLIVMHFLMLSFFSKDPSVNKTNNLLQLVVILLTQFSIEGLLIGFQVIDDSNWTIISGSALIAPLFTIPHNILATYLINPEKKWKKYLFLGLWFSQLVLAFVIVILLNIQKTSGMNSSWVLAFAIGVIFEAFLEIIIMVWKNIKLVNSQPLPNKA